MIKHRVSSCDLFPNEKRLTGKIRGKMYEKKITMAAFCKAVGISARTYYRRTYRRLPNGKEIPGEHFGEWSYQELLKIFDFLGFSDKERLIVTGGKSV